MVGFAIEVDGFGLMAVCADTMPKARYVVWKDAQEIGYTSVTFARIKSKREPRLDRWAEGQPKPCVREYFHALENPL